MHIFEVPTTREMLNSQMNEEILKWECITTVDKKKERSIKYLYYERNVKSF